MTDLNVQLPLFIWHKFCRAMDVSNHTIMSKKEFEKEPLDKKWLSLWLYDQHLIVTDGHFALLWVIETENFDRDAVARVEFAPDYLKQVGGLKEKKISDDVYVNLNFAPHLSQCTVSLFELSDGNLEVPVEKLHDHAVFSMTQEVMGKNAADRLIAAYKKGGEGAIKSIRLNTQLFRIMQGIMGDGIYGFTLQFALNEKVCMTPVEVRFDEYWDIPFRFFFMPWSHYEDYNDGAFYKAMNRLVPHLPPLKAKGE